MRKVVCNPESTIWKVRKLRCVNRADSPALYWSNALDNQFRGDFDTEEQLLLDCCLWLLVSDGIYIRVCIVRGNVYMYKCAHTLVCIWMQQVCVLTCVVCTGCNIIMLLHCTWSWCACKLMFGLIVKHLGSFSNTHLCIRSVDSFSTSVCMCLQVI